MRDTVPFLIFMYIIEKAENMGFNHFQRLFVKNSNNRLKNKYKIERKKDKTGIKSLNGFCM